MNTTNLIGPRRIRDRVYLPRDPVAEHRALLAMGPDVLEIDEEEA